MIALFQKIKNRLKIYQNYYKIVRKNIAKNNQHDTQKSTVLFDFTNLGIIPYQYALINYFSIAGYNILVIKNKLWIGSFDHYSSFLVDIPQLNFTHKFSNKASEIIYITDRNKVWKNKVWKKYLYLNCDIFSLETCQWQTTLVMPYPMHPNAYGLKTYLEIHKYRESKREVKLFFSGNQNQVSYRQNVFKEFFKKMNRIEILDTLVKALLPSEIAIVQNEFQAKQLSESYQNKFVLRHWIRHIGNHTNMGIRVKNPEWLETLAKADFFLGCSGTSQPMCHNAVEAMSVGTIPVLEYATHFVPALEHEKNAIIFDGQDDLLSKVRQVLAMPQDKILQMRQNVIAYYEQFLNPVPFVSKVEQLPLYFNNLYVLAESASHAMKNRH